MSSVGDCSPKLRQNICLLNIYSEVESSRTSLVSRTLYEVLSLGLEGQVIGLGFEASSPQKLPCSRLEDSIFFELLKCCRSHEKKKIWKTFFTGERLKEIFEDLFFWRTLALVSLVLGLASSIPALGLERVCPRKGCPWPCPQNFLSPWPRALCSQLHLCIY